MCGEMATQPVISVTIWGGISVPPQTKHVTETETHPAKAAEVSERLKLLFFFHVGETQVCTTASAEKHENSSQGKLLMTVGACHGAEMPTDGSREGNGSATRE